MRDILADKALLPIGAVVLDCTMPGTQAPSWPCSPKAHSFLW